jgi:hypothetical protein
MSKFFHQSFDSPREASEIYHFVDQKMYFRDYKSLSVFERKIPLAFFSEYRFHQDHA